MGTTKDSEVSSDRQKWQEIFNALVQMLQNQQRQLESLVEHKKILEDRIKTQYNRWVSDVRLLEDHISEMKSDFVVEELARLFDAAKSDLAWGLKEREASVYKLQLDQAENDISDITMCLGCLSQQYSNLKDVSKGNSKETNKERGDEDYDGKSARSPRKEEQRSKILETEVRSLRQEYEKLSLKKDAEVSALLLEKDFVWNQLKTMEADYTNKLKSKSVELERADEKIEKLLASMEQMQSLNSKKDVTITKLETKVANLAADKDKMNSELSRLSLELELSRKSRNSSVTPVLKRCSVRPRISGLGGRNSGSDRSDIHVKKEPSASQAPDQVKDSEKGTQTSKRKAVDAIPIPETPKLFSATFKVPKLKNPSRLVQ